MLQKLNERIQGVIAWAIIILIAITFAIFGVDYYLQARQASQAKATVNGEAISLSEFEVNYRRMRAQRDMSQLTAKADQQLKASVLDQLISSVIQVQSALNLGFEVSKEQANASIVGIPQFKEDGQFSSERYQQALSRALYTPESFQKEVQQGMLLNQQKFAFAGTAFVLPKEVDRFIRLYLQTRDFKYLQVPMADFEKKITVTEKEINRYYEDHKQKFQTPERVSVDYVLLSMKDILSKQTISEDEVNTYYQNNQDEFRVPARWRVAHILLAVPSNANKEEQEATEKKANEVYGQLLDDPNLFVEMVKKHSDDKLSIPSKGELPWIVAGETDYDDTLVNMTKPGDISKPVKTKHGFEIFKLIAYKPTQVRPFLQVKKQIKQQLTSERAQQEFAQDLDALTDLSYRNPDSLKTVSDELSIKILTTPLFTKEGGDHSITQNKMVIDAAFTHDVLDSGNNSEPIQLDNDAVLVLRLNKHEKPTQLPIMAVQPLIRSHLLQTKAMAMAKSVGEQLIKENALDGSKIQETYQLKWREEKSIKRDDPRVPSIANQLAFSLTQPGLSKGSSLPNGNYMVVALTGILEGKKADIKPEELKVITRQLESNFGLVDYELYISGLMKQAKIEKHE